MIDLTASFADRIVFRVGYGAMRLERLPDRRSEAVALLLRAVARGIDHAPNLLLIPGTADAAHLEANMAASEIAFDDATLDAIESRSNEVRI